MFFFYKHRVNPTWGSDMLIFFQNWASKYAYPYAYFCGIFIKFLRLRRNEICTLFCQGGLVASVCFWTKSEAPWCFKKTRTCFWSSFSKSMFEVFSRRNTNFLFFFQSQSRQYAYQFDQYAYFFSKRASGMLINDMLIEKKHVV